MRETDDLERRTPEQLDPFLIQDKLSEGNRILRACALDLGARYLADLIGQRPSTVQNQLVGHDPDKRPSYDLGLALALSHGKFRRAHCALLCPPPSLEPADGINEIEREVLPTLGEHDGRKLRDILRRVKR